MEWASFEQSGPSPVKRREQRSIQSHEDMKLPESNNYLESGSQDKLGL